MMKKKQIGVFGGTFDPIHFGHLLAAEQAREQAQLDEIWFMPARIPPHKERGGIASEQHRYNMVELAIADHSAFQATDIELKREGPSYTIDTMECLTRQHPELSFSFIIGGDMVEMLPKWRRYEDLIQLVHFIGLYRPGSRYDQHHMSAFVTLVEMPAWDLSSTLIREKVAAGKSIRYLLPQTVETYIKEHGLYGSLG